MSINKVILLGAVGKEPEIRAMSNGNEIATFSLATSKIWKDKTTGEKKDKTEWHKIAVYNSGLVNIVKKYVKKGTKLYIEGSLQTNKFTDKNGVERMNTIIAVQGFNSQLEIVSSIKSLDNERKQEKQEEEINESFNDTFNDEIPFNLSRGQ